MSKQHANHIQIGQNVDPTKNAVIAVDPTTGVITILRGSSIDSETVSGDVLATFGADGVFKPANSGPAFSAVSAAAQTIPLTTDTKVLFGAEQFDLNSCYDPATSQFNPKVAGYYAINATITMAAATTTGGTGIVSLYKNGAGVLTGARFLCTNLTPLAFVSSFLVYMNGTTDYVDIRFFQSVAASQTLTASASTFSAFLARVA